MSKDGWLFERLEEDYASVMEWPEWKREMLFGPPPNTERESG